MQIRMDLKSESSKEWVKAVLADFPSFLQDHADCERKASSTAMSFVAKYPDRVEIIPELIETAIEELEHFDEVYKVMQERGIQLAHKIPEDLYVKKLIGLCRSGREDRFMDRMLLGSVLECRGAERFKVLYENLEDAYLKDFYHRLWATEAKHADIYVRLLFNYFEKDEIYERLEYFMNAEAEILADLPIRPALH